MVICPDRTVYNEICWPPSVACFDPYFEQCAPEITAAFSADKYEICSGELVHFYDGSTWGDTSWLWTFEGGNPSTSDIQNPVVNYDEAGTFDVSLTVSDGTANSTSSVQNAIAVYPLPLVTMSALDTVCVESQAFELSGGYPAGGEYSAPAIANGMFHPGLAGVGSHTITYSYTDLNGCENSATTPIIVTSCAGIEDKEIDDFQIYPNPAKDEISLGLNYSGKVSVKIYNVLGISIFENEYQPAQKFRQTISLSGFSGGLYVISIHTDQKTCIKKLKIVGR